MAAKLGTPARILLGLIFFVFGLNGFLNFIPAPPQMPEAAMGFIKGMMSASYFFPVLKGTEVICGLLLLIGFYAPLALIILAPITLQIFLFHSILTPGLQNVILPLVMGVLHIIAAKKYWHVYRPLFNKKV
jgi:uncharacterized membrane protein YphA (DoxX/SURF4 family)